VWLCRQECIYAGWVNSNYDTQDTHAHTHTHIQSRWVKFNVTGFLCVIMWAGMDLIYEGINVCLSESALQVPRLAIDLAFWVIANIVLVSSHTVTNDDEAVRGTEDLLVSSSDEAHADNGHGRHHNRNENSHAEQDSADQSTHGMQANSDGGAVHTASSAETNQEEEDELEIHACKEHALDDAGSLARGSPTAGTGHQAGSPLRGHPAVERDFEMAALR
jgi:hypothetical protein